MVKGMLKIHELTVASDNRFYSWNASC